jgi:hypothetical protein
MHISISTHAMSVKFSGQKTENILLNNCSSMEAAVAHVAKLPKSNHALTYEYGEPFERDGRYYVQRIETADYSSTAANSIFNGDNHPLNQGGNRWTGKKNQ